jgi:membrane-associated protease RseP (regulator of RpoE activity)
MVTAKAFGMKVTRYFAGFGPTLFSFRRGETEYGLKAVPLGGFVKIVGMTPQDDDVEPGDEKRAMWRYPVWKRTIVMSAGSLTHFMLGFVLLWIVLTFVGIPNPALADSGKLPAYVTVSSCAPVPATAVRCPDAGTASSTDFPTSPAKAAGLQDGDKITALDGTPVTSYGQLVNLIRQAPLGSHQVTYERNGATATTTVELIAVQRYPLDADNNVLTSKPPVTVSALGVSGASPPGVPTTVTYGPVDSLGKAGKFTGQTFTGVWSALKAFPERIPNLWHALNGGQRDPNGPISVVGASRLGGETAEHGQWFIFLLLAASLNFFVGVFNLLPLLPLDGGHIAVAWFERIRSWVYARFGRRDPGRVNYAKLMPVTYVVILVFGAFTLLTVGADIVNPVTLFR